VAAVAVVLVCEWAVGTVGTDMAAAAVVFVSSCGRERVA
jgi:hypothetical protein